MNVAIVVVTHNRLEYTRLTVARLLSDPHEPFDLYLWDNGSTDGTAEYLKAVRDPRLVEVTISRENVGQSGAMNAVWSRTRAELVGKLDNDCLVTPGWTRIFARAHRDIAELGSVACWPFPAEVFDERRAAKKIQWLNGHRVFRHPWTCGSGFIMKRHDFAAYGPWRPGPATGTTNLFLKLALAGRVNGWYYPLVLQEHMDDPASEHSRFHRMSFTEAYRHGYGYKARGIDNMEVYLRVREEIIRNLLDGPYRPRAYAGWQGRLRRLPGRLQDRLRKQAPETAGRNPHTEKEET